MMKKSLIYLFIIFILLSCKSNNSSLGEFDSILSNSNIIVIHFNENKNFNEKAVVKVINNSSQINELRNLMSKSTKNAPCTFYDGTMTFFFDKEQKGYSEFSVDPYCPAFYFHNSNGINRYSMTPYCAMFLEGIRQGNN